MSPSPKPTFPTVRVLFFAALLFGAGYLLYAAFPRQPAQAPTAERIEPAASGPSSVGPAHHMSQATPTAEMVEMSGRVLAVHPGQAQQSGGVAHALLTLTSAGLTATARSHENGEYRVTLRPGLYTVAIVADGYFMMVPDPPALSVQLGATHKQVDFKMVRGATIQGRVRRHDGLAIAGATMTLLTEQQQQSEIRLSNQTDAQGRFMLMVPPRHIRLRAVTHDGNEGISQLIYAQAGATVSGVEIVVGGAHRLQGRVVAVDGRSAVGAPCFVVLRDEVHDNQKIPCDAQGQFHWAGVTPGIKLLQAWATGYSPSRVTSVIVKPLLDNHVVLTVAPRRHLVGTVEMRGGEPVLGAQVTAQPAQPRRHSPADPKAPQPTLMYIGETIRTLTDANGQFILQNVPDLPLDVMAVGPDGGTAMRRAVPPGTMDTQKITLTLDDPGTVSGVVTDGVTAAPVTYFHVVLEALPPLPVGGAHELRRMVATADGRYELTGIAPGTYRVFISGAGYGPSVSDNVTVTGGTSAIVNAVLNMGGSISGVVRSRQGVPIPGAYVDMETGTSKDAVAITDASGKFELHGVAPGYRSITAHHPDFDAKIISGVSIFVSAAGKPTTVLFELFPRVDGQSSLRFSGVGAVLSMQGQRLTVMQVIPGSPAEIGGVQPKDVVIAVAGRSAAGRSLGDMIELIRGIEGTSVRLDLSRNGQPYSVDLIRREVVVSQ